MSRVYRIRVSERQERLVSLCDGVETELELLPLLPKQRLSELLAVELEERGFAIEAGKARRSAGDWSVEIELATGTVKARIEKEAKLECRAERTLSGSRRIEPARVDAVKQSLRERVEAMTNHEQARHEERVTRELEQRLSELSVELDRVVHRTTAAALKEKASKLGDIVEMSEDEMGSLTIRVKL